ncbi:hypothetical protein [Tenacibaculum piscium]|uniref:hypothetical protein n=1 Tax=Tenacibaculum piscium TaxID=1458515 RepID=UPI001F171BAB|nr:hypothetical protein [Tenacibaculum piscium]
MNYSDVYNDVNIKKYTFDSEFTNYITLYQDIYKRKVLQIIPEIKQPIISEIIEEIAPQITANIISEKKETPAPQKRDIKKILEDFFFTPRYDNVLDALKLGSN